MLGHYHVAPTALIMVAGTAGHAPACGGVAGGKPDLGMKSVWLPVGKWRMALFDTFWPFLALFGTGFWRAPGEGGVESLVLRDPKHRKHKGREWWSDGATNGPEKNDRGRRGHGTTAPWSGIGDRDRRASVLESRG